jgi:hypothetical protein
VLEIGCGWGGFAEFAAGEIGCKVTGLTISREQLAFARERMAKAGLADRVELKFQDYRDETGTYDRIVSIEMFEAVGEKYWPAYFSKLNECLKPGGRAGLQIITILQEALCRLPREPGFHPEIRLPRRHAADPRAPGVARPQFGPCRRPRTSASATTMPAPLPNGATASGRPGSASCRSASTSVSESSGNSTSIIARQVFGRETSTCGRWFLPVPSPDTRRLKKIPLEAALREHDFLQSALAGRKDVS